MNGQSTGATSLNRVNHIGTLGSFSAADFALTNGQALAVTGPVNGGASTALTTTAGDLAINGAVTGTTTTLKSAGAISEAGGSITASSLSGQSTGATSLNGANHIGTLGSFSAAGFALTNGQALAVNGPVNGGANTTLTTSAGDLAINGAVTGTTTTLKSAGAISEGAGAASPPHVNGQSTGATSLNGANHIGTWPVQYRQRPQLHGCPGAGSVSLAAGFGGYRRRGRRHDDRHTDRECRRQQCSSDQRLGGDNGSESMRQ